MEYAIRLKHLAVHCNFGNFLPCVLRDQFVRGVRNPTAKTKLLSEDRTFNCAVQYVIADEAAQKEVTLLQTHPATHSANVNYVKGKQFQRKPKDNKGNNTQNVSANERHCQTKTKECYHSGVPQGSNLGPLLFLIYINDLADGLKCNVKLYADDTLIFTVVHNLHSSSVELNHDLNLIKLWAQNWRMSFNPDPAKQAVDMIFSTKRVPMNHQPVFFNGVPVVRVHIQKHLGIILHSKLSFAAHIQSVISKCRQGIGMLRLLSNYLPCHSLIKMYKQGRI